MTTKLFLGTVCTCYYSTVWPAGCSVARWAGRPACRSHGFSVARRIIYGCGRPVALSFDVLPTPAASDNDRGIMCLPAPVGSTHMYVDDDDDDGEAIELFQWFVVWWF